MSKKTNKPFDKQNELILNFLKKHDIDYAILLNGNWGSGKTYYCNNILFDYLKKNDFNVIRVSLFGQSDINSIWDNIIIESIKAENNKFNNTIFKTIQFIKKYIDINKVNIKSFFSINIKNILSEFLEKKNNNILKSDKTLFIFDDLERCDNLMNILGQINYDFIEKGYHVLFVANKKEIRDRKFKTWSEKLIRNTFNIPFNFDEIKNVLKTNNNYSKLKNINICYDVFCKKIDNYRTWFYSFDIFCEIFNVIEKKKLDILKDDFFKEELFYSILLKSYYILKNEEFEEHSNTYKYLYSNDCNSFKKTFSNKIFEDFKIKSQVNNINYRDYKFLNNYIRSGYIDDNIVCNEIEEYYPKINKFYNTYYSFFRPFVIDRMNQEELKKNVSILFNGIIKNEYNPKTVIHISKYFEEHNDFLLEIQALNKDYEKKIENYVDNNLSEFSHIYNDNEIFDNIDNIDNVFPNFLKSKSSEIKNIYEEKKNELFKKKFNEVFINKKLDINNYESLPNELKFDLLKKIDILGLTKDLLKFDCEQIFILRLYINNLLSKSNAGEFYYEEKEYLERINNEIKKSDKNSFISIKTSKDFETLSNEMEKCCAHLNNTK